MSRQGAWRNERGFTLVEVMITIILMGILFGIASSDEEVRAPEAAGEEDGAGGQDEGERVENLTPREIEVLTLLSRGQTNPQIAQNLTVSRGTVKIHVQHIISKLGVSDRTQAAVRAIEAGVIETR